MVLVANEEEPAERHDREHDVVRELVEHKVLDFPDLLTGPVGYVSSVHLKRFQPRPEVGNAGGRLLRLWDAPDSDLIGP